jgi:tRNA dimethylallyltransferase
MIKDLTSFISKAKRPLIVILGPTNSGKTGISVKIAKKIKGEIISTDSRQIYRDMDISNDIILPEEEKNIPHHLLRIADPDETITLAQYKDLALKEINEIYKRGKVPMLVGGTGLYISSIIEGYDVPRIEPDPELRKKLGKEDNLYEKLEKLDPEAAKTIHPNNKRYIIRALEINLSGQKKSDIKKKKSPFDIYMIGIETPREKLYEKINKRVDEQVERGLIDEAKTLLKKGYSLDLPSMSSLGVKEIIPYIKGEMPLEDCLEILKRNTRRYAKRQMTWFRRYDNVNWLCLKKHSKI